MPEPHLYFDLEPWLVRPEPGFALDFSPAVADCLLPVLVEAFPVCLRFFVSSSLLLPPFLPAWVGLLMSISKFIEKHSTHVLPVKS
jgi:hypothetical protein